MNRIETLLGVLAEECAEVAQRCSKAQRFGIHQKQVGQDYTNAGRIDIELQDVYALVEMIQREASIPWFGIHNGERIQAKQRKVERYMAPTRDLAALDLETQSEQRQ